MARGRKAAYWNSALNTLGLQFIAVTSIYALRLGATASYIGLISSFNYLSFFFMFVGRPLVPRVGAVRLWGIFWAIRFSVMLPVVLTPLFAKTHPQLVLAMIALGLLGFAVSKGVGVVTARPVIGELAHQHNRGAFLARLDLISHILSISSGTLVAFFLGEQPPFYLYGIIIFAGVLFGLASARAVFKFPEPVLAREGFRTGLWRSTIDGFRKPDFRRLIILKMLKTFTIGVTMPFLIVLFRNIYNLPDGWIMMLTVAGGLGSIVMSSISVKLMDPLGARRMFIAFGIVTAVTFCVLAVIPESRQTWSAFVFGACVYFFATAGTNGMMMSTSVYFYGVTKPEERLNLGLVFQLSRGFAGLIGSLSGGFILDGLRVRLAESERLVWSLYFAAGAVLYLCLLIFAVRLPSPRQLDSKKSE